MSRTIGGQSRFRLTSNLAKGFIARPRRFFAFCAARSRAQLCSAIMFRVTPAVRFRSAQKGRCTVGDFTLLNGALVMAEEMIEIGSHCLISWNVGIADSDFHPLDPAQRLIDAQALAPFFKDRPPRPEIKNCAGKNRRQRLDRNERGDPQRRHDWRKLGRGGGRRRHQIRSAMPPLAAQQPPRPPGHGPPGRDAAASGAGQDRPVTQRRAHRCGPGVSSDSGPGGGRV